MKEYVLNYYSEFKCIAEKCKHTCCAGWEMYIDANSLSEYKKCNSEFSYKLKQGIDFKRSKFKRSKFKRCAFLNDKGLCEIIMNLGENSLCQVCRDHPRFRSFFDDRTEMGLGFCCEESARIILCFDDKIEPVLISDDKKQAEIDFIQKNILEFRKKALEILQDRAININDRIDSLLSLCNADFSECDFKKIIKTFLSLEKLDRGWAKTLKTLPKTFIKNTEQNLSHYCEQFLVNSLYRYLSDAEDTMWVRARAVACVFAWWLIKSIISIKQAESQYLLNLTIDVVRAYSAEVEYSTKNLNKLFNFCYKFIKI